MEQYHFVIKDAKSASLSKGDEEEAYRIRSHAQTRRRQGERSAAPSDLLQAVASIPKERSRGRRPTSDNQEETTSRERSQFPEVNSTTIDFPFSSESTTIVQSHWNHYFWGAARGEELDHPSVVSVSVQPSGTSIDPFNSTNMIHHFSAYRLMQFLQSDFNSSTFRAEALGHPLEAISRTGAFHHEAAYSERMRHALQNDMMMFSILAYASGAIGWRYGVRFEEFPPEYFIQQTYRSIRERLQRLEQVEEALLWSCIGLAAAEMWLFNFDAAATYMRAVQVLIS
ncbi:hypothetical protein Z517_12534 [Fonsecaea pedrosoi CBS 271.37]|uniref:Transcription factor domain-containing protein n=1 Tax=Fonsecaea pedrosoi CBS 271.37 TaxID=1442368 RepID=A0A0D2GNZ6_9EURO|nr:uncharacterized protein Z517_12534 [Fonsecaea pedrosoi CBS 271.37]KIW74124.1 hypothetical protein Z517_12534 [Fonsecaea pedrosoi CBS 271.37]